MDFLKADDVVASDKSTEVIMFPFPGSLWKRRRSKNPSSICGEEEVVRGVHTLIAGVLQVCHRLQVGGEEKGRKVEQEEEREEQGEETAHVNMNMEMG